MPVPRERVERALVEALNKDDLTNLRTVGASVGLTSTRRFYRDFRDLRLAIVATNRGKQWLQDCEPHLASQAYCW